MLMLLNVVKLSNERREPDNEWEGRESTAGVVLLSGESIPNIQGAIPPTSPFPSPPHSHPLTPLVHTSIPVLPLSGHLETS